MARLTHPDLGTIIECDGAVEDLYRAMGWTGPSDVSKLDTAPEPATSRKRATRPKKPAVPSVED